MDNANELPDWIPAEFQTALAAQSATNDSDTPLHLCICISEPYLSKLEETLTRLYDNPITATFYERQNSTSIDGDDTLNRETPDAVILKSSTGIPLSQMEHLKTTFPDLEFNETGGTPHLPDTTPVIILTVPEYGEYDPRYEVHEQIPIAGAILDKFHFTLPFSTFPNEAFDVQIAQTFLNEPSPLTNLKDEISTVQSVETPPMCTAAKETITEFYVNIREARTFDILTPNATLLTATKQFAEIIARTENADQVTESHANTAIGLANNLLPHPEPTEKTFNTHPTPDDMNESEPCQPLKKTLTQTIEEMQGNTPEDYVKDFPVIEKSKVIRILVQDGHDETQIEDEIEKLIASGRMLQPQNDLITLI